MGTARVTQPKLWMVYLASTPFHSADGFVYPRIRGGQTRAASQAGGLGSDRGEHQLCPIPVPGTVAAYMVKVHVYRVTVSNEPDTAI